MDELETVCVAENEKPPFSRVGWSLFALLGVTTALQILVAELANNFAPQLNETWWLYWVLSVAPLYFIAMPLSYIILKPIPKLITAQQKISFKKLLGFLAMSYAVMYIGNLVGTALSAGVAAAKGEELINPLVDILTGSNIYIKLAVVGLIAPILEELVFRKFLLDRIRVYGEGMAILVSGLAFGLIHGNLFQFFYAFGVGALFAYIYLRTGKIRYTIILHAIINTVSVILSQLLLGNSDVEAFQNFGEENLEEMVSVIQGNLPQYILAGLCSIAVITLLISGFVLLIKKRKQVVLFATPKEIPKGQRFKKVFLNWGMALFILLSIGLMTYTTIAL